LGGFSSPARAVCAWPGGRGRQVGLSAWVGWQYLAQQAL